MTPAVCTCGHLAVDHAPDSGECLVTTSWDKSIFCYCKRFEPVSVPYKLGEKA